MNTFKNSNKGSKRTFKNKSSQKDSSERKFSKKEDSEDFSQKKTKPYKSRSSKYRNNKKDSTFDDVFYDEAERKQNDERKSSKKSYERKGNKTYKKYPPKKVEAKEKDESDGIRLNKYIANSGICSRREADQLISTGAVTVNGKIVTELGIKVKKSDTVKVDNRTIKPEKNIYLILNKPKDFITTSKDPHERKTVMHLVEHACEQRIYPVGRLDRMTTGVLLFTNDGDLAKKLTHPKHKVKKIYHVSLDKPLLKNDMVAIAEGVELEDGFTPVDEIAYPDKENKKEVGIEIHSGKNRIVRRIFEHYGYQVVKLDRVLFAGLTKKNVPRGKWRLLSEKEIILLKRQGK